MEQEQVHVRIIVQVIHMHPVAGELLGKEQQWDCPSVSITEQRVLDSEETHHTITIAGEVLPCATED